MSNTGFYGKNRKRPAPAQKNFATENAAAAEENTAPENLVVGRNAVREVLRAGRDIEKLMVAKGDTSGSMRELVALAKEKNVIVHEVDRRKLDELAPNHQGIAAFVSMYQYAAVKDILDLAAERGESPFVVVLDGITVRTARWYYLSSLANQGLGNSIDALQDARRAVQLDPNNTEYQMHLRRMQNPGQTYRTQTTYAQPGGLMRWCWSMILLNLLCNCCCNRGMCCGTPIGYR